MSAGEEEQGVPHWNPDGDPPTRVQTILDNVELGKEGKYSKYNHAEGELHRPPGTGI